MPTPDAIAASNKFRMRLLQQEADAIGRMGRIYARIYQSLLGEIDDLADDIWLLQKQDKKPSRDDLIKLARLQRIKAQVADEAARFGVVVQGEVDNIRAQAIQQGVDDAIGLIDASLPVLPDPLRREIVASLTRLPTDAVEQAAGLLAADSPLMGKLEEAFGLEVADLVEMHIVDGIAIGQNPRTIAAALQRNLQSSLGTGLNWVATTVRTAQIKSYQLANHATYQANSDIVPNWVWVAKLDARTCMSCVAQHGSVHPVTETMQDHHNGRCAPLPQTISYKALGINLPDPVGETISGETWFNQQPEALQRTMMGPGKFEAWQAGKFKFGDLTTPYQDDVYGRLLRETTLRELMK